MNDFDVIIGAVSRGDIAVKRYCVKNLTLFDMCKLIEDSLLHG
jgi:hypothetical protein